MPITSHNSVHLTNCKAIESWLLRVINPCTSYIIIESNNKIKLAAATTNDIKLQRLSIKM